MQLIRIKLWGRDLKKLESVCEELITIAKKMGINHRGPIPLPTKKLKVTTLKTPCGQGTGHGNASWDTWELRIHRKLIDIQADDRVLHKIMRMAIPKDVEIEIKFI